MSLVRIPNFKRGDRIELNALIFRAMTRAGMDNIVTMTYDPIPELPSRIFPLRGFDGYGKGWPSEGTLGWVMEYGPFPTPSIRPDDEPFGVRITTDQGHSFWITENCLEAYP